MRSDSVLGHLKDEAWIIQAIGIEHGQVDLLRARLWLCTCGKEIALERYGTGSALGRVGKLIRNSWAR
jgi:hypothetical protein